MLRRKGTGEVVPLEQRRNDTLEEARLSGIAAEKAESSKDEIASAEARGEIDAAEAERRYREADETAARHRREVDRLARLAVKIEEDITRYQGAEARKRYEAAVRSAGETCAKANQVAEKLGRALAQAVRASAELEAARAERKTAMDEAHALCPAELDFDGPDNFEEPEWLPDLASVKTLRAFLKSEDERRSAELRRAREAEESKRAVARRETKRLIGEYVKSGDPEILDQLSNEAAAEAQRHHEGRARKFRPAIEEIVERVQHGGSSVSAALAELHRIPSIDGPPADQLAEARRRIEAAARVPA